MVQSNLISVIQDLCKQPTISNLNKTVVHLIEPSQSITCNQVRKEMNSHYVSKISN